MANRSEGIVRAAITLSVDAEHPSRHPDDKARADECDRERGSDQDGEHEKSHRFVAAVGARSRGRLWDRLIHGFVPHLDQQSRAIGQRSELDDYHARWSPGALMYVVALDQRAA